MHKVARENLQLLAKRIKELREKESASLNKFVMSKGYITTAKWSRVENGKFDIKLSTLLRIAQVFNMSLYGLIKEIDFNYNFTDE